MIRPNTTMKYMEIIMEEINKNNIDHPDHYQDGIECIDEMIAIFGKTATQHFCLLNVWKYRKRAIYKNGKEDMDKADWYMKKYLELGGKSIKLG